MRWRSDVRLAGPVPSRRGGPGVSVEVQLGSFSPYSLTVVCDRDKWMSPGSVEGKVALLRVEDGGIMCIWSTGHTLARIT